MKDQLAKSDKGVDASLSQASQTQQDKAKLEI